MKAGKSNHKVGTKIRIKNIEGEDADMNGLTGKLTHPFGCHEACYVGVWLEDESDIIGSICTLMSENEFELI